MNISPSQTYEKLLKSERMSTRFFHSFILFLTEELQHLDSKLLTPQEKIRAEKNIAASLSLIWDLHHLLTCNHSIHLIVRNPNSKTTLSNKEIKNSAKRSFQMFQHIAKSIPFIKSEYRIQCEHALEKILSFYLSSDYFVNITNNNPIPKPWKPKI
ncbi:hypothetical protein [Lederbergia lenta]|uniref:Uncharacterized protein n=1 Tax=Lederbergia lenta TaxID=1467 RepID=A0A2X4ZMF8_LEDLE|nr:hypothetical protein [Lederbergia lenta]MCM3113501.1 hypothetical protein [Lederbergia lenta]MEC2326682.1 hypothetical protein [Lederbergia lenta]SQI61574.1 Uncharacterised protein [Lederbergia lenta]